MQLKVINTNNKSTKKNNICINTYKNEAHEVCFSAYVIWQQISLSEVRIEPNFFFFKSSRPKLNSKTTFAKIKVQVPYFLFTVFLCMLVKLLLDYTWNKNYTSKSQFLSLSVCVCLPAIASEIYCTYKAEFFSEDTLRPSLVQLKLWILIICKLIVILIKNDSEKP